MAFYAIQCLYASGHYYWPDLLWELCVDSGHCGKGDGWEIEGVDGGVAGAGEGEGCDGLAWR